MEHKINTESESNDGKPDGCVQNVQTDLVVFVPIRRVYDRVYTMLCEQNI